MTETYNTSYDDALYEQVGNIARFADGVIQVAGQESHGYDAEFLEWHGHPEVAGTNGKLAGVLIDEDTITLIDMESEKIIRTDDKVTVAFMNDLRREKDEKQLAKIMDVYQRLVAELVKRYTPVAV